MLPVICLYLGLWSLAAEPSQIPDPVPVGTTTLEVHINKNRQPITTRYDIDFIPRAIYLKRFGPLTDQDARNYERTGYVLHIVTVYIGTF